MLRKAPFTVAILITVFMLSATFLPTVALASSTTFTWNTTAGFDSGIKSTPSPTDYNYGVETNTDNPTVTANTFNLTSVTGDRMDVTRANVTTVTNMSYKWATYAVNISDMSGGQRSGVNVAGFPGRMNVRAYIVAGANTAWGVVSRFPFSGDFNATIKTHPMKADVAVRIALGIYNEKVSYYTATGTVDGAMFEEEWNGGESLTAYTITNGVKSSVGATYPGADVDWNLRIVRIGTSISFWRSPDGLVWTRQSTTTFSIAGNVYFAIAAAGNSGGRDSSWWVDDASMTNSNVTAGGVRAAGNWTSTLMTYPAGGQFVSSIRLGYSGATAQETISKVSLVNSTGVAFYNYTTPITSGTSFTITLDGSNTNLLRNLKVKVYLSGDGLGTVSVNSVSVTWSTPAPGACSLNTALPGTTTLIVIIVGAGFLLSAVLYFVRPFRSKGKDVSVNTPSEFIYAVIGIVVVVSVLVVLASQLSC